MARSVTHPGTRVLIATLVLAALVAQVSTVPALAADVGDTTAPTAPTDLHLVSRARSGAITLGWIASTDAVGVAGYRMYRDGRSIGTLYQAGVDILGTVWYDKLRGRITTAVTYELYAFDAAGNVSTPATYVLAP